MDTLSGSAWLPGADITRHAGSLIPSELDFFTPPPPEIGRVISADSSLKVSQQPKPIEQRLMISGVIGLGVGGGVWLFMKFIESQSWIVLGAIVGVTFLIAYACMGFGHWCSYVGEQGIVEFRIHGSRSAQPKANMMLFKDAANLYTSQTRHYKNGIYTGTSYNYTWRLISGKNYALSGSYRKEKGIPDDTSPWHFANVAEGVWSSYLLGAVNEQLNQRGYVEFPLQGNPQAVRIGNGFLEFVSKDGSEQRAAVADMKDIKLGNGLFQFNHKDARWWSGKGKYSFNYASIPNARLFLMCLKQLAGISWS